MRALLSFIVSTISFALSLWPGAAAAAEPFNWGPQVDDPIHTPAELVESMHSAFGYNHCRAVHAKGIILQGEFTPDTHAKEITRAPHLQGASSKVTVRFSDFSGVSTIPDNDPMANPRGMAIRFELAGGASTDVTAHSFNGFPVSDTDDLRELMLAIAASTVRGHSDCSRQVLGVPPDGKSISCHAEDSGQLCHHLLLRCWFVQVHQRHR